LAWVLTGNVEGHQGGASFPGGDVVKLSGLDL